MSQMLQHQKRLSRKSLRSSRVRSLLQVAVARMFRLLAEKFETNINGKSELRFLGIVGRPVGERRIDKVMDIDTVIVLKGDMSKEKYKKIEDIFADLRNLGTANLDILYQIADGPIKPLPNKEFTLFFHVILHTEESYRKSPLVLVKNSWQYETIPLIGPPLGLLCPIPRLSREEVVNGLLGLRHCRELLTKCGSAYLGWCKKTEKENLEMELCPIEFSERCEIVELCFYSVLRAASNSLRWKLGSTQGIGIEAKDMQLFEAMFSSFTYSELPFKFWLEKTKLRRGAWYPSVRETNSRMEQTITFLEGLERRLT